MRQNSNFPTVKWGFVQNTQKTSAARKAMLPPSLPPSHLGAPGRGEELGQGPVRDFAGHLQQDILAGQGHPHLTDDGVIAFVISH